jgi:cytochrome c biogenesis factor
MEASMYREERIKLGIDISIVYFGVTFLTNLISQVFSMLIIRPNLLSVGTDYLDLVQTIKLILILALALASYLLYKKYKTTVSEVVFIVAGILLIISSLSTMAYAIQSVIASVDQARQNGDLLKQIVLANIISAINNTINLVIGIFLILFGEQRIQKQKIPQLLESRCLTSCLQSSSPCAKRTL